MLSHIRDTIFDPTANAAYWCGVYSMRREYWLHEARLDKSRGYSPSMAIDTAREYNYHLIRNLKILREAGVTNHK